jgi:hypothetical protein
LPGGGIKARGSADRDVRPTLAMFVGADRFGNSAASVLDAGLHNGLLVVSFRWDGIRFRQRQGSCPIGAIAGDAGNMLLHHL